MSTVMSFLTDAETTMMQMLSLWWYYINTPRIQRKVAVALLRTHDFAYYLLKDKQAVFMYNCITKKVTEAPIEREKGKSAVPPAFNFVQTPKNRLFVVGGSGLEENTRQFFELEPLSKKGGFKRKQMPRLLQMRSVHSVCAMGD